MTPSLEGDAPRGGRWSLREVFGVVVWCAVGFAAIRAVGPENFGFGVLAFAWLSYLLLQIRSRSWVAIVMMIATVAPAFFFHPLIVPAEPPELRHRSLLGLAFAVVSGSLVVSFFGSLVDVSLRRAEAEEDEPPPDGDREGDGS